METGFLEVRWLGKTLYVSPNISLREGVGLTGCLVPGAITTEVGGRGRREEVQKRWGQNREKEVGAKINWT